MDYTKNKNHNLHVLQWWKDSGLPLIFTNIDAILNYSETVEWWINSGLLSNYTKEEIEDALVRIKEHKCRIEEWNTNSERRTLML